MNKLWKMALNSPCSAFGMMAILWGARSISVKLFCETIINNTL